MRAAKQRFLKFASLICGVLALCGLSSAQASTVLQMSFEEVVDAAELVFEGRVTGLRSQSSADGSIHTLVSFQISDVIKGEFAGAAIELRFLGGQVGMRGLQVSDMRMPEQGETGIYFVESLRDFQVNPLVGWAQGHFLIEDLGSGASLVTTAGHVPVVSVQSADGAPASLAEAQFSKGVAKGVSVRAGIASKASRGLSAQQFKASVREIVELAR
tara:strand:- start:407 stop:1051 length:645 start_codon:yes stop_codon:yes gene_type:complete